MGAGAHVVVVGGTGFYGRYLVEDLCRTTDATIVVAARRRVPVDRVWPAYPGRVSAVAVDHHDVPALTGLLRGASVVVHCAGPFQALPGAGHPLGPLRAALAARTPYVDISEDWAFRREVLSLAGGSGVPVLTGASVVPGMQVILAVELAREFDEVAAVRCVAAPDTRKHRGEAMFRAMLHGAGLRFRAPRDGVSTELHGWSEPEWVHMPPPIGRRLVYQVYEMADAELMVERFGARTVSFKAGTEFSWLNRILGAAAAVRARTGRPRRFERFTPVVRGFSWLVGRAGDEAGGFVLELSGSRDGGLLTRAVGMTSAREGGRIPALLAAIAVEDILAGRLATPGVVAADSWLDAATLRQRLAARDVVWWRRVGVGSSWVQWDDAVGADVRPGPTT